MRKNKLRLYSFVLSVLMLASSMTACTKQAEKTTTTESSKKLSAGENELKVANAAVSNNIGTLDSKKEVADVESDYEYTKEIEFWKPEQKFEITTKSNLDSIKVDDKIPAVQFFLDNDFTIEIATKYDYEVLGDGNQKYTVYPNSEGLNAVSNLYYYEDNDNNDTKQNIKGAIRLRGGNIGWGAGDIIYMLQNVNFETGEKLDKPVVTTIVIDREERDSLTPEYYVNENGEFYAQWDAVEGADAYAIVSYYKMPDQDKLDEVINKNNEKAKENEENASLDDPLVINELVKSKESEDDGTHEIFYVDHSIASVVDIVSDTKYSINDAEFYSEHLKKEADAGYITSTPNYISTSLLPESSRYLSVVALKKGTGSDGSETIQYEGEGDALSDLLKELDEESTDPTYFAVQESPLYDFNALATNIPSYVKKYESKYPSTSKFTVDKASDITNFVYVEMTDGSIRKHNLEYMDEYTVESKDLDKDDNKEDIQEVLSIKVKVKGTPFYFNYNIKDFDKADPSKDVEIIKNTFDEATKFKADLVEYPPKAPIVKIDKANKSVTFINDGEKKFYNANSSGGDSSNNSYSPSLDISSTQSDGGIGAYSDSERAECLPDFVVASTTMSEEIAWAMTTGQKQFVLNYNTDISTISDTIYEVCWQNQYILELDFPNGNITQQSDGSYLVEMDYFISDINQRKEMQRAMKSKSRSILNSLDGNYSSTLDLLYKINNYLCDNVVYDDYAVGVYETTSRTAYGPLIEGKGVCSAYSRTLQLLMTMSGLTCYVDGGSTPSGKHAWNVVSTSDGYYMVDSTWNDGYGQNLYLMVPEEIYGRDHASEGIGIREYATRRNVNYAYSGGDYDYLSNIGKAVSVNSLDDALYAYGSYGYCPDWLRVYNLYSNIEPYLSSAAQALTDEFGNSYSYYAEWSGSEPGIVHFDSPQLTQTSKSYGEKIE